MTLFAFAVEQGVCSYCYLSQAQMFLYMSGTQLRCVNYVSLFTNFPELIQTEMHHVRTLKILLHVYMHELRQSLLIEEAKLERLFLGVENLLALHQLFLNRLKMRQNQSQEEESPNNYQITQLGDILISQVG